MFPWFLLVACHPEQDARPPDPVAPPTWDEAPPPITCAASLDAPLLDAARANAGLTHVIGWDEPTWQGASYRDVLDDAFRLPWYREVHWDAHAGVACFANQLGADLDHAMVSDHPVASAITVAMDRLGTTLALDPLDPATTTQDLADLSSLPPDLATALTPILAALAQVKAAQDLAMTNAPASRQDLVENGHGGVLIEFTSPVDLTDPAVQDWVLSETGPRGLQDPARVLAYAVEHADLGRFAGLDLAATLPTPVGKVIIAGPGPDEPGDIGNVALYLDLGGDDTYVHPAGANSAKVAGAVHVDLGGADTYAYELVQGGSGYLLPSDEHGRYGGDAYYGPVSLSRVGRQGSGRFGVGLLFDLGGGDDTYLSLRGSQGWGALGVGVLYDDGGNDLIWAEAGAQGAASMGIGLLIGAGDGADAYTTFANSQGFGWTQGVGFAWDGGGSDTWYADPGDPAVDGHPLYYTPQRPGTGNSSFSQGAGFGMRNDGASTFLSGGLGVLRDLGGDDRYTASVFGQGTGYWQGTGLLLDATGDDTYEAYWYVQGGAAHYAIGALMDGAGNDSFNPTFTPSNVHLGSGHDFSVGLLVNDSGDDRYHATSLALGSSNCQGVGVFVDGDGSDTYVADSELAVGLGNHSTECEDPSRTIARSIGLFLDSGSDPDSWTWSGSAHPAPADDATFGYRWNGTDDERGGAVDGDGEPGFRAGALED